MAVVLLNSNAWLLFTLRCYIFVHLKFAEAEKTAQVAKIHYEQHIAEKEAQKRISHLEGFFVVLLACL